jgi:hypothetical protein
VTPASKRDYIEALRSRYVRAPRPAKARILDEVCKTTGCHRKSAIRVLAEPPAPPTPSHRRGRPPVYGHETRTVLIAIWDAASYPWSERLKALLPLWLPWARRHFAIPSHVERQLRGIGSAPARWFACCRIRSAATCGTSMAAPNPGTLLKHHLPIKAERWAVTTPGFVEVDLVSHSGNSGDGTFLQPAVPQSHRHPFHLGRNARRVWQGPARGPRGACGDGGRSPTYTRVRPQSLPRPGGLPGSIEQHSRRRGHTQRLHGAGHRQADADPGRSPRPRCTGALAAEDERERAGV